MVPALAHEEALCMSASLELGLGFDLAVVDPNDTRHNPRPLTNLPGLRR